MGKSMSLTGVKQYRLRCQQIRVKCVEVKRGQGWLILPKAVAGMEHRPVRERMELKG